MNDNEIIELFFSRSEQAILAASGKYGSYCGRIAGNLLHSPQDREECLSDTWLTAWNAIPPTRPEKLGPFLGKITRNLCLTRLRDQGALKRGGGTVQVALEELSECIPGGSDPQAAVEQRELTRILDRFLAGLKQEARVAFVLRYYQAEPVAEVARRLGCTESKAKTMLFRTRKQLHDYLEQEGITL